jgi:pimeloyl-ACP methyl ester carboxylesterase
MKRLVHLVLVFFFIFSGLKVVASASAASTVVSVKSKCMISGKTNTMHFTKRDGSNDTIEVPANWNGTLILYSHGYVFSSSPLQNPGPDASDPTAASELLTEGYALAGSSYSMNGWAVKQAFQDQIDLLNDFDTTCGTPLRTIAWGDSMGGLITAGLAQLYPERFAGALPMCGLLSGSLGLFNLQLDGLFALNFLLAGGKLQMANFTNAGATMNQAQGFLDNAQSTALGRARIALIAALEDIPGLSTVQPPNPSKYDEQEVNQYHTYQGHLVFDIVAQTQVEEVAGGNDSWTVGVKFADQFKNSSNHDEVVSLYAEAGMSSQLQTDLSTIDNVNSKTPVYADKQAVSYMDRYIVFNGKLTIPVLTMHTIGDNLVFVQVEQAYAQAVKKAGSSLMLRQMFVDRVGHCNFTSAEKLAAMHTLIDCLNNGGKWGSYDPNKGSAQLNLKASGYGPQYNGAPPAFFAYTPKPFLTPLADFPGGTSVPSYAVNKVSSIAAKILPGG